MEVLILQVFVSLMLVVGSIILFATSVRRRDFQHGGQLSLLPLDDDAPKSAVRKPTPGVD